MLCHEKAIFSPYLQVLGGKITVQVEKRGGKYKKKIKKKERRKNKTKIIRFFAVYFLTYNMVHEREGKGIKNIQDYS